MPSQVAVISNMELMLRLLAVLQNVLCKILDLLYWLLTKLNITIPLQPIRKNILTLSATEIAAKIRTGELSCEDVIQEYMFRSKRVNMKLNAIVEERYAAAFEEADKVDELIASKTKTVKQLEEETPLLGVPVTIKESCKVKGMSYTVGSRLRVGKKADTDGVAVGLLRRAGAIPIAVSSQPELCLSAETHNPVCGLTRNPYDEHRTVGGSSGGEAALVGSAGSVVGLGSDLLGSIRCPAMFTGIFGHRPTPRSVCGAGHYPGGDSETLADHLVLGPLTRYAEDLPLMMKVLAGDNATALRLGQQVSLEDIRVYYMTEAGHSLGLPSVENEIKIAIMKAADYLKTTCQCDVKKANFSEMSDCPEISSAVLYNLKDLPDIFYEIDPANPKERPNLLKEYLKSLFGQSTFSSTALQYSMMKKTNCIIPENKINYYIKQNEKLKKKIVETLGEDGVLLFPTYPTSAHYHYQSLIRTLSVSYCAIITSLGLPATNVPMGLNKNRLPIGLQVIAAPHQDRLCFAIAKELEKAFGGWIHPPCLQTPT